MARAVLLSSPGLPFHRVMIQRRFSGVSGGVSSYITWWLLWSEQFMQILGCDPVCFHTGWLLIKAFSGSIRFTKHGVQWWRLAKYMCNHGCWGSASSFLKISYKSALPKFEFWQLASCAIILGCTHLPSFEFPHGGHAVWKMGCEACFLQWCHHVCKIWKCGEMSWAIVKTCLQWDGLPFFIFYTVFENILRCPQQVACICIDQQAFDKCSLE